MTVLESWIVKYGAEATVATLVGAIQSLNLQNVVDAFYREFQIPKLKRTGVKTRPHSVFYMPACYCLIVTRNKF